MTRDADPSPYTIRAIQEMLGLSRGVITGLIASGFVAPSRGPRNEYRFTFREVVLLRTAVELQAARIPPRKILASLRKLKASLEERRAEADGKPQAARAARGRNPSE